MTRAETHVSFERQRRGDMSEPFSAFDAAQYLHNDEAIRVFMADALEKIDTGCITHSARGAIRP